MGIPLSGFLISEIPLRHWPNWRRDVPFSEEPAQILHIKRDGASERQLIALAQSCADAGDGVSLSAEPVRSPPVFHIEHDGRGAAAMAWSAMLKKMEDYVAAAQRAEEAARIRHAAEVAAWEVRQRAEAAAEKANRKK